MATRTLLISEVVDRTGLCRRTIYQEISDGRFPRPVQLTARRVGWPEEEIDAWLRAKIEARDREAA
ncbi:MAG TPA: AlpA family phage regulatory protein [Mesorhizobium sp.]|jgi:prophage regulatory protein|nr:AlpA family phage regulatory protein [Mesorhizobium sp.]